MEPTPICVPCHKEMTCHKNGVLVLFHDSAGRPFFIRGSDMYKCGNCGNTQMKGYSTHRVEHWETEWPPLLERWKAQPDEFKVFVE